MVRVLEGVADEHGLPQAIRVDNGPEFISKDLDPWAYFAKVRLDFSRPATPTDNALIEAFNSRFRQECLNEPWFLSLADAQEKVDAWREDYNWQRPHSVLGKTCRRRSSPSGMNLRPRLRLGLRFTPPPRSTGHEEVSPCVDQRWGQVHWPSIPKAPVKPKGRPPSPSHEFPRHPPRSLAYLECLTCAVGPSGGGSRRQLVRGAPERKHATSPSGMIAIAARRAVLLAAAGGNCQVSRSGLRTRGRCRWFPREGGGGFTGGGSDCGSGSSQWI